MLYFTQKKENCTGCSACVEKCPKKCISMKPDERGFLYPEADLKKCIKCGLCEKVCPIKNPKYVSPTDDSYEKNNDGSDMAWKVQHAAAAISKDNEIWENSASGGAFSEICNAIYKVNYKDRSNVWVYGAAFEGLEVQHCGKKMPEIQKFRKSKYVQSDMRHCFREIEDFLNKDEYVIFSGTPCQVAGLRSYLGKGYENLFCIDLICHGVGSPEVFKRYLEEIGQNGKVRSYTFRIKRKKHGNYQRYLSKIDRGEGRISYILIDNYNKLFLNQLCLRNCCGENCRYRVINRQGDLTIADFNHFTRLFPDVKDDRGYSTIVVNTVKGEKIFQKLSEYMDILPCDLEDIKKYNPLLVGTTPENPLREAFFNDFADGMSIQKLSEKYVPNSKKSISMFLKSHIPYFIKYPVFRILHKVRGKK